MCFPPYPINRETGEENWDTEGCQTLPLPALHTKCLCSKISTFAVLAQKAKDPVSATFTFPLTHLALRLLGSAPQGMASLHTLSCTGWARLGLLLKKNHFGHPEEPLEMF